MKLNCLILFVVLIIVSVTATDYYVDPNGSDSASGASVSTAWKTVSRVNSQPLQPGDFVRFKRGAEFYGSLKAQSGSSSGGFVTFTSYGDSSLPKPAILGSIQKNQASDWELVSGSTKIWLTGNHETAGSNVIPNPSFDVNTNNWSFWNEGTASATFERDTTTFDTAPAGSKITIANSGTYSSALQVIVSPFNTSFDKSVLTFRAKATKPGTIKSTSIFMKNSPWTTYATPNIYNINVTTNWETYTVTFTTLVYGNDARFTFFLGVGFEENTILYIDTLKLEPRNGGLPKDIGNIIFNNQYSAVRKWNSSDLGKQGDFHCNDSLVMLFSETNPATYYSDIELAINRDIIEISSSSYTIFDGIALKYGAACGINGQSSDHVTIKNMEISFIGGGILFGYHIRVRYGNAIQFWCDCSNNIVENNLIWEIYDTAITSQCTSVSTVKNIIWRYNIIWNSIWCYEFWNEPEGPVDGVYVENNICAFSGWSWSYEQRDDPSGYHVALFGTSGKVTSNYYIRNNIFYLGRHADWYVSSASSYENFTIDNNLYFKPNGTFLYWSGKGSYKTWDSFRNAINGKEQHSILADPKWESVNLHNFKLLTTSPAIDKGTRTSANADFFGNSIPCGAAQDIGPIEYCPESHKSSDGNKDQTNGIDKGSLNIFSLVIIPIMLFNQ